jgi:predicted secreted hydrolase
VIKTLKKVLLLVVLTGLIALFFMRIEPDEGATESLRTSIGGSPRLSELLGGDSASGFPLALQVREFSFPDDHGPHPQFRNEWWYFTGNLDADGGERFGYELTLFRFALAPRLTKPVEPESKWTTNQIYIGHFAISDVEANQFHVAQRYSRGGAELAGSQSSPFRVWLDDWSIEAAGDNGRSWILRAREDDIAIELELESLKPPVLNGQHGLSKKSAENGNASYYYSLTRLQSNGSINIGKDFYAVRGMSWLDREWGSSALSVDQVGWDWFALQLSDGSDLMFYNLRRNNGSQDVHSAGTLTNADGTSRYIDLAEIEIDVLDYWDSDEGGRYPMAWSLQIAEENIELEIRPVMANQELSTLVRYWEGAVDVSGTSGDEVITGRGYVELTGYADNNAKN